MITLKQAFATARAASNGVKLDPIAYDLGDSWAFDYGGDEPINGFFPVIVDKNTGKLVDFAMPADFERMGNAHRVKVGSQHHPPDPVHFDVHRLFLLLRRLLLTLTRGRAFARCVYIPLVLFISSSVVVGWLIDCLAPLVSSLVDFLHLRKRILRSAVGCDDIDGGGIVKNGGAYGKQRDGGALFFWNPAKKVTVKLPENWKIRGVESNVLTDVPADAIYLLEKK